MSFAIAIASSSSVERDRGEHRAEDLLARDRHVVRDRVEDRRLDVVAARVLARAAAAEVEAGALALARLDVAEHAVELGVVDDRAHPRLRIERVARLDPLGDADDLLEQLVLDRLEWTSRREPALQTSPWL